MFTRAVPRRFRRIGLVALVVAPLAAAACTTPPPPQVDPTVPTVTRTVLLTPDGRTAVPAPAGQNGTDVANNPPTPLDINDRGQVVGQSPTEAGSHVVEPVLWQDGDDRATRLSSEDRAALFVNDRGQVVIERRTVPEGEPLRMPTLWQDGEEVELPYPYQEAMDFNERGEVLALPTNGDLNAAVWADGRVTATVRPPRGADRFAPWDISDDGTVVGSVGYKTFLLPTTYRPFVWRNGTLTELRMSGRGIAINNAGQVLILLEGSGRWVLWRDGVTTDLGLDIEVGLAGYTRIINDRGQVVGARDGRAHLWDNGRLVDLGTPAGTTSMALAVNEHGQVVGTMDMADGTTHGFVWTSGHLLDLGPVCYNLTFCGPMDINDRGQIIGRTGDARVVDDATAVLWRVHDPAIAS